jgi:hypothetical protein
MPKIGSSVTEKENEWTGEIAKKRSEKQKQRSNKHDICGAKEVSCIPIFLMP